MSAAYVNLGMLLLENPDETAAVAPLRKAVELLPAESRPRYLLAVALDRSGDRAGAAQAFAALLDLDPNEVHALEYLGWTRSEEHTSELQSLTNLVCRLLLEKKNENKKTRDVPTYTHDALATQR